MRRATGFTLLEMLIVLLLVVFVSMLLMQGMSQVITLRLRLLAQVERQRTETLEASWFKEIASYISAPISGDKSGYFEGDDDEFSGMCLASLINGVGSVTHIRVWLEEEDNVLKLLYSEKKKEEWELASWFKGKGKFRYLDSRGSWRRSWPPASETTESVPYGIMLEVDSLQGPIIWYSNVSGRRRAWKIKDENSFME